MKNSRKNNNCDLKGKNFNGLKKFQFIGLAELLEEDFYKSFFYKEQSKIEPPIKTCKKPAGMWKPYCNFSRFVEVWKELKLNLLPLEKA